MDAKFYIYKYDCLQSWLWVLSMGNSSLFNVMYISADFISFLQEQIKFVQ